MDLVLRSCAWSLFQRFGAVKAKARQPIVECLTRGTSRRTADSDLRLRRPFLLGWIIDSIVEVYRDSRVSVTIKSG
jgi:hypothetical protein